MGKLLLFHGNAEWVIPFYFGGKVAGQVFQHELLLGAQKSIHRDDKWGKMMTLLETGIQVLMFFLILMRGDFSLVSSGPRRHRLYR